MALGCQQSHWRGRGCCSLGRRFATWFSTAGSCVVHNQHDGNMEKDASGFDEVDDTDLTTHGKGGWSK
jgi:hypothetical protein